MSTPPPPSELLPWTLDVHLILADFGNRYTVHMRAEVCAFFRMDLSNKKDKV